MTVSKSEITKQALLKVSRAKDHINDLNGRMQAYFGQKPYRLMTLGDAKSGQETHFIKEHIPVPDCFPLIIGDAVHNLRSALDIMMFKMIGHLAKNPSGVQFPFCKAKHGLVSTMTNRETERAGEQVVAEIEALEPYGGGNEWLYGLHQLDITDKHKLIIPAIAIAEITGAEFREILPTWDAVENVTVRWPFTTKFVFGHKTITRFQRRANRRNIRAGEYERNIQPPFDMFFSEGECFTEKPIIPTLVELTRLVESVVDRVSDAYIRQNYNP